jgi:hypothetical protein
MLDGEKRAAVPFRLAAIPFYNFVSLKLDHNAALVPLWALTTWAFMRSLDTRRIGWAVLFGLAASASLLTKCGRYSCWRDCSLRHWLTADATPIFARRRRG